MKHHHLTSRRAFLRLAAIGATGTAMSLLAAPVALAAQPLASALAVSPLAGQSNANQALTLPSDAAPLDQQVLRYIIKEDRYIASGVGGYNVMWELRSMLFESQTAYTNDWDYEKGMADSWDVSPDGTVYTYHLHPGLTWSDGQPITADDFVNHYQVLLDPKNATDVAWYFFPILNGEQINLGQKEVSELGASGARREHAAGDARRSRRRTGTSSWPTEIRDRTPSICGTRTATSTTRRWRAPLPAATGRSPTGPRARASPPRRGPTTTATSRAICSGSSFRSASQRPTSPPTRRARPTSCWTSQRPATSPLSKPIQCSSKELYSWPQWTDWYLLFHTQDGPYKDLRVRQAVSHAIDRDAICNGPLKDLAMPSYTIIPPGFPGNQADDPSKSRDPEPRPGHGAQAVVRRRLSQWPGLPGDGPVDPRHGRRNREPAGGGRGDPGDAEGHPRHQGQPPPRGRPDLHEQPRASTRSESPCCRGASTSPIRST